LGISRDVFAPNAYSGLVFAGFGDTEIFPALTSYKIDAYIADRLRIAKEAEQVITTENSALIVPFAQSDDVWAFMEGINRSYQTTFMTWIRWTLSQYPDIVAGLLPSTVSPAEAKGITRKLGRLGEQLVDALDSTTRAYRRRHNVGPVMRAVDVLPKDELANMAESLVSLTSFKKRMSMNAETVGGPVDVAVISKGDGFIWIRRKHYFDPRYNPHFTANYFRETLPYGTGEAESSDGSTVGDDVQDDGGVPPTLSAKGQTPNGAGWPR
jgi:hypothetical protein